MRISDWSSDVCSSDLVHLAGVGIDAAVDAVLAGEPELAVAVEGRGVEVGVAALAGQGIALDGMSLRIDADDSVEPAVGRSEERRDGNECVSPCSTRWSPSN